MPNPTPERECATCGRWVDTLLCPHCTNPRPGMQPEDAWPTAPDEDDGEEDDEVDVPVGPAEVEQG